MTRPPPPVSAGGTARVDWFLCSSISQPVAARRQGGAEQQHRRCILCLRQSRRVPFSFCADVVLSDAQLPSALSAATLGSLQNALAAQLGVDARSLTLAQVRGFSMRMPERPPHTRHRRNRSLCWTAGGPHASFKTLTCAATPCCCSVSVSVSALFPGGRRGERRRHLGIAPPPPAAAGACSHRPRPSFER